MSQTPSERFTECEEAAHEMQERIEAERSQKPFNHFAYDDWRDVRFWRNLRQCQRKRARLSIELVRERFATEHVE